MDRNTLRQKWLTQEEIDLLNEIESFREVIKRKELYREEMKG